MNPYVQAFVIVGPAMFLLGFFLRNFIAPAASSPAGVTLTDEQLKGIAMAVFAEVQPDLDTLNQAVSELPAKVAAAVAAGADPAAAQDKADTIDAVKKAAEGAVAAINAVGQ